MTIAVQLLHFDSLANLPGVTYGITTRHGGVSDGAFSSLNLSFHVRDDAEAVRANRVLLAEALGCGPQDFVCARQPHGEEIAVVGAEDHSRGAFGPDDEFSTADALITSEPGAMLMCFSADCPPVLLFDPARGAAGVAHSGWRGTVRGIAGKTVSRMQGEYGTRPEDLIACIGPGIGACCFEVGAVVLDAVENDMPLIRPCIEHRDGRAFLGLHQAIRLQLLRAGVDEDRIEVSDACTHCRTDIFYSYRAESGRTGRFALAAGLR